MTPRPSLAARTATTDRTEWIAQAACRNHDPELWFPYGHKSGVDIWTACRPICLSCPVIAQCLEDALTIEGGKMERHGMAGGKTPEQRRRIYQNRQQQEQRNARREAAEAS